MSCLPAIPWHASSEGRRPLRLLSCLGAAALGCTGLCCLCLHEPWVSVDQDPLLPVPLGPLLDCCLSGEGGTCVLWGRHRRSLGVACAGVGPGLGHGLLQTPGQLLQVEMWLQTLARPIGQGGSGWRHWIQGRASWACPRGAGEGMLWMGAARPLAQ